MMSSTRPDTPAAIQRAKELREPAHLARVLVIDDDPLLLNSTRRILGKDHDVTCAIGASVALTLLRSGVPDFDAIVCDLFLAGTCGEVLQAEIKRINPDMAERVIFVAENLDRPEAKAFLAKVTNPRLQKPFDFRVLRATIRRCFTGKGGISQRDTTTLA